MGHTLERPPALKTTHARVAALSRDRAPDDPELVQARRALKLAVTEQRIAEAIEQAPPLDADTLARLHSLIPAVPSDPSGGREPDAA